MSCKTCKSDCCHAGKRNPHMTAKNVCNSHSDNRPRSGNQPIEDILDTSDEYLAKWFQNWSKNA